MQRQFDIFTDSSADLPKEYYEAHAVHCIPLGFMMDGVTYEGDDGAAMDVKEFYARLRGGAKPTTFQITPEQAKKHFESSLKNERDILVIAFSSGLSGTAESYVSAARDLSAFYPDRKIFIVDSLCASLGEGLFVDYIVKKADSGASIEETRDYAEMLKPHICHYFTVDNLFHLKRGGRVSAATAVVGTILKIKPVLYVDDRGHLIPIAKAVGRKKAIGALLDDMMKREMLEPDDPVFISHGDCLEDANTLAAMVRERFGERQIFIHEIGSVIGSHSGAGTLALFFRGKQR